MPKAFIVCGAPAAGKTSYGKKLATAESAVFLDIDTATERLVQLALQLSGHDPADRDSEFFKQHFRMPIYEQLFDIAADNLSFSNVVITGPFTREIRDPDWPDALAERLGAPVEVHYVTCKPEVRKQRMIERGNPRDAGKLADWGEYVSYYGDEEPPCFEHVLVYSP
ncbi:MAG: ATP-binding protein [Thiolinea sp.]